MARQKGVTVKLAIEKLTLPELLILGRTMQIFYAKLEGEGSADLGESLPVFDNAARHALKVAFAVPNGATVKQGKEIRSPAVKRALAGIPPVDPVVKAVTGAGEVYRTLAPNASGGTGMTFEPTTVDGKLTPF